MSYLQTTGFILDLTTADPTGEEGQVWFRSDLFELRAYYNGGVVTLLDASDLAAHTALANPHGTSLEDARQAGDTLAGPINMGGNLINALADPVSATDAATRGYVLNEIANALGGLDFQDSVLDKDLVTAPGSPTSGDRYIIAGIGGGWSGGTIDDIAEWDGAAWIFTTPNAGFTAYVEDESVWYIYDGAAWNVFSAGLTTKSGVVASGSFAGNPRTASVVFAGAFPSTAYAIVLTPNMADSSKSFVVTATNKAVGGFDINLNSNKTTGMTNISWVAIATGEA